MLKTAEFVSLGHPDKSADYISSYILDRLIEQDPNVKYAVEVMFKGNTVVLGGEVCGNINLEHVDEYVKKALCEIGYLPKYSQIWGENAVDVSKLEIVNLIGCQSAEIYQGVEHGGWGDQGVFVGYACQCEGMLPLELFLAQKLNNALYAKARCSDNLGLDIKTQITIDAYKQIKSAIVAIPMLEEEDLTQFIIEILGQEPKEIIVNGTGRYTCHSAVADCGITGRKLACDFYSTACPVGGGSPWTKDSSKADLTLNLFARKLAIQHLEGNDECYVYLSSCIGQSDLPSAVVKTRKNGKETNINIYPECAPKELIKELKLKRPIYAKLCQKGLVNYFDSKGKLVF